MDDQDIPVVDNFCLCILRTMLDLSAKAYPRQRIRQLQFQVFQKKGVYIDTSCLQKYVLAAEGCDEDE